MRHQRRSTTRTGNGDFNRSKLTCYVRVVWRVTVRYTYTKRISISDSLLICGLLIGTTGHEYIERISKGNIYCKADRTAIYRINIIISFFFDLRKMCFRNYIFQPLFQYKNNCITVCINPLNSKVSRHNSVCTSCPSLMSFIPLNHRLLYFTLLLETLANNIGEFYQL